MGFFFRRSAKFGPIRLNFSKSGLGASLGVAGARVTRTAKGTTYITVGSHGFYYRETLATDQQTRRQSPSPNPQPIAPTSTAGTILSAESAELVDSSSERLVQELNQRARMFNPAWIFYVAAAAICYFAVFSLGSEKSSSSASSFPDLPDVTSPIAAERAANKEDDFSMVAGRYGEPDSIRLSSAAPLARIPVEIAQWTAARVNVAFVPNGCTDLYNTIVKLRALPDSAASRRRLRSISQCRPTAVGWTIVGYADSAEDTALSAAATTSRLNSVPIKETPAASVPRFTSDAGTRPNDIRLPSEMKSTDDARKAAVQRKRDIRARETRSQTLQAICFVGGFVLLFSGVAVHRANSGNRETRLFYELDDAARKRHELTQEAISRLAASRCVWRVESKSATSDWKRNAGAAYLVNRTVIRVGTATPPRVKTNISVPRIDLGRSQLFFLPDTILYRDARGFGSIAYADFKVTPSSTRFIEDGSVPSDAVVVGQTWRYVNKNGGPDRRFNNNRQLPVLQLGVLIVTSSQGLDLQLNTSNPNSSAAFVECWHTRVAEYAEYRSERPHSSQPRQEAKRPPQDTAARKVLGVDEAASASDISAAYRRLAQKYHPDKVAGLAPEFQELADRRMREINAAYEELKQTVTS